MIRSLPLAVIFCVSIMAASSCRKKEKAVAVPVVPAATVTTTIAPTTYHPPEDKTKLNALFASLRATPQSINVTAGVAQSIKCAGGTVLTFYPNSFRDASGNVISSGTVNLQVVEMYKPGQMIVERAVTTSGTELLASGGQVRIAATMGGAQVNAGKYGLAFKQQAASTQPMSLFYGSNANDDSVTVWGAASTAPGTTAAGTILVPIKYFGVINTANEKITRNALDTSTGGSGGSGGGGGGGSGVFGYYPGLYYSYDSCPHFNWVNCDRTIGSSGTRTDISMSVFDTGFNSSNTQAFFSFPEVNSVVRPFYTFGVPVVFSTWNVSEGMKVTAVIMARKYGVYYYGEQMNVTITTKMVLSIPMTAVTESELRGKLWSL